MRQYVDELKQLLKNKLFVVSILLVALLSYGFAATHISVGIDDLEIDRYVGSGNALLAAGRFATVFWAYVFGYSKDLPANSAMIDVISVIMMCVAAVNLCVLFRRISRNTIGVPACTIFSCVLVSYPLMNEIWEYTGANLNVCVGLLLASVVVFLIYEFIHRKTRAANMLVASLLMMLICAGYESIVSVYVFCVFAILLLQVVHGEEKEKRVSKIIRQGIYYTAVLVAGLILRIVVHQIILSVMNLEASTNGATEFYWQKAPVATVVKYLVINFVREYGLKGIIYFPITELLLAALAFLGIGIVACKKYGKALLLPGLGILLTLILLSIVQGSVSPYRTCQVFGIFVAFVAMLAVDMVQKYPWKKFSWIRPVSLVLMLGLCLYQAVYLNHFLTLNHYRSEEEAHVIGQIGAELEKNYDPDKPIIFVGKHELSKDIQEAASISQSSIRWKVYKTIYTACYELLGESFDAAKLPRKLPQTNVSSALEWGVYSYNQEAMQNLFAYYGFDYVLADYEQVYNEACQYAVTEQMPSYPQNGYIRDVGEYIIVRLGEVEG